MDKKALYEQSYHYLEEEVIKLSNYIYITDRDFDSNNGPGISPLLTYSSNISDLLTRCVIEIESLAKFLYTEIKSKIAIGSTYPDADNRSSSFRHVIFQLLDKTFNLKKKVVNIYNPVFDLSQQNRAILPFSDDDIDNGWYDAYNSTKHNRYDKLQKGNVKNLLHALAALFLLNIYLKKDYDKPNDGTDSFKNFDYSFGSNIFSINEPPNNTNHNVLDDNKAIINDTCPLVIKYSDNNFGIILQTKIDCENDYKKYINSQGEIRKPEYLKFCSDNNLPVDDLKSICEYRKIEYRSISNSAFREVTYLYSPEFQALNAMSVPGSLNNVDIDKLIEDGENCFPEYQHNNMCVKEFNRRVRLIPFSLCINGIETQESYKKNWK